MAGLVPAIHAFSNFRCGEIRGCPALRPGMTMLGTLNTPLLIPASSAAVILRSPHPLRGVIARRRKGGLGCGAPRVRSRKAGHPGGGGAPPGLTKKPCQELADDLRAQAKRLRSLLPRRFPSAGMERGWKRCEDRWRGTYGESGACRSDKSLQMSMRSCQGRPRSALK